MAARESDRHHQMSLLQLAALLKISMVVPADHPLLMLKKVLDWAAIREVITRRLRFAGHNVDGGRGRPLNLDFYVPALVLMALKNMTSREMEEYLSENAVARVFVDCEHDMEFQIRDHSNLARVMDSLGADGLAELNALIVRHAVSSGFANEKVLSADTTCQEVPIGYPNEPGILKGLAERCIRLFEKLKGKGKRGLSQLQDICGEVVNLCKEHHLFAKTKEEKEKLLRRMIQITQNMLSKSESLAERLTGEAGRVVRNARFQLKQLVSVGQALIPQIQHWLKTGLVAKGKILHVALSDAQAIVRNKAGKKVEFGYQYLINVLGGGYIFAKSFNRPTGESKMPSASLDAYRQILGEEATPEMFVYDRGGWSQENARALKEEGVEKVGIQPKGRARWHVGKQDRRKVLSERGKTEGVIGTLKSAKYGFNKPLARRSESVRAYGQKSVLSYNLNKLLRDHSKKAKAA